MSAGDPKCFGSNIGATNWYYTTYPYVDVNTDAILRIYEAIGNGQIDENQARVILELKFGCEVARKLIP